MSAKRLTHCPECRTTIVGDWNFCKCGAPLKDLHRVCNHCHRIVESDAASCVWCGRTFEGIEPCFVLLRWQRRPGEFARRIVVGDLRGALDGGVMVDHGTRALFLVDGVIRQELPPGWKSTVNDPLSTYSGEEYAHRLEVIAVDAGQTHLRWRVASRTADRFQVDAWLDVCVSLRDAAVLSQNVLKDRNALTFGDLEAWLEPEVSVVLRDRVKKSDSESLRAVSTELLNALEQELRQRLEPTLGGAGLRLERVRELSIESPRLADLELDQELGETTTRKADLAHERLAQIERLQDAILHNRRLEDTNRLELVKSRVLTEAEAAELEAEIERVRLDEHHGWERAREILAAKHSTELVRIAEDAEIRLFTARVDASLSAERRRLELKAELKEREAEAEARQTRTDREHKAKIGCEILDVRERSKREWVETVRGMSAEELLAVSSAFHPESAKVLHARYEQAGREELIRLRQEMEEKLLAVAREGQEQAYRLAEEAIRAQATYRESEMNRLTGVQREAMQCMSGKDRPLSEEPPQRTCPKCGRKTREEHRFCPSCGEPLA